MKNYTDISEDIVKNVGGIDNVINYYYCMTRFRLNIVDQTKVNLDLLKSVEGVMDAVVQAGQLQIIFGSDVNKLYSAFNELYPQKEDSTIDYSQKDTFSKTVKGSKFGQVTETIASLFIPVIPCLAGSGIIKSVLSILVSVGIMTTEMETYQVFYLMADVVIYFLPFIIAVSAARKFKANEFYAVVMAGILMSPTILELINGGMTTYHILGIPMLLTDCSSTVIPIILTVLLLSYVQKFVEKIVPSVLRLMLVPALCFIIVGSIALIIFAPFGTFLGSALSLLINTAMSISSVLAGALLGGLHLLMVITGTHYIEVPLIVQEFTSSGSTSIMSITSMGNMAISGSIMALILKAQSANKRGEYSSIFVPTILGITEPALYGYAITLKTPLIASMIGGAVGGAIVAASGFAQTVIGGLGLFSPIIFIGTDKLSWFIIAEIAAVITAFLVTYFVYNPKKVYD